MMKLKYWKKTKHSAYLSLDDLVWGVLSVRTLHHLFPYGEEIEISDDAAHELIEKLENAAWHHLTDYLAKAEHSENQCRNFLMRRAYHQDIIDKCIHLAKEKGYLDDIRFAEILIRSLYERGKSRRAILMKLRLEKISPQIAEPLLESLHDPESSKSFLKDQIVKLSFRHRDEQPYKRKEKIFASLFRKGFSLDEISSAWDDIDVKE